ncbi:bifunctional ADP-dependent NAD(P)H-hydrate dehydratase/NAD(P)H-hydrate epimerase [Candidatus Poribacteria bacterium]|nr:MAG: bifunctional ADP-dependent NAD(P)H-hydrate dehydratase/NAD(P)H-hydrate epimerase [Candidatus Poribacteria bacterium]
MKVVTAAEMRQIDQDTIEGIGIPGIVLMETAGSAIVRAIEQHYPRYQRIGIFVGKGNNGGDGIVIARQLAHAGRDVHLFLVSPPESFTGEAEINLQIAKRLTASFGNLQAAPKGGLQIETILTDTALKSDANIANCELLVDAILGTGLRGTVRSPIATVIKTINTLSIPILSVDLPSGLDADTGHPLGTCVQADRTITIGLPKRGLLVHPGAELAGELEVVDIGFPEQVVDAQNIKVNWTTTAEVSQWVPPRPSASHKGTYGRVLVVAGSTGMTGAAALASEAALRVGAGLVTLATPKHLNPILEGLLPEVMTLPLPETESGSLSASATSAILEFAEKTKSVLAIGPGLSQHSDTVALVHQLVGENREQGLGLRMVIDADGLNALAKAPEIISLLDRDTVLTPHPGEMSRLTDTPVPTLENDRISTAQQFANECGVTLVFKGAPTVTAGANGEAWINSTGNPGMATGGMGDVLTGVIAGLMAQGHASETAAVLGVYIHGLAGDITAEALGMHGLIASDVLKAVPKAISSLISQNSSKTHDI